MSRRTRGEGSVVQRKDGRWQGSLQVAGVRRTVYGRTRSEVAAKLNELQRQAVGGLPDPGKRTVGDLVSAWLEVAESDLRPKTLSDYRHLCAKHILPVLADVKLSRLEPLVIERLLAGIQAAGHKRTAQRVWSVLHRACVFGVRWRWLSENPLDRVQRPQYRPAQSDLWTPAQVVTFLQAVQAGEGGQYAYLLGFLLASGCRIGEALGLRSSDVDFDAGSVSIERQITEVRSKPIEQPPKTESGIRTIAIPSWGVELLRQQRAQVATWRLHSGHPHTWPERVFPTSVGTVPLQGNVRRALHTLCDSLGLPRIRVHDLRHISLSLLAGAGVPVKDLQKRAGHSTPRMTLEIYTHVLADSDQEAARLLEKLAQ